MNVLYRTSGMASATSWQEMVKVLREATNEQKRYLPIMTDFERQTVAESIGNMAEQYRPTIEAGALQVWQAAVNGVLQAQKKVEGEKKKALNSWDATKLAPELQVYTLRIESAAKNGDVAALKNIYQEAQEAGDHYKLRACAEALQGVVNKIPQGKQDIHGTDARMVGNNLEMQARRNLETLQSSEGYEQAEAEKENKIQELNTARKELFRAAEVIDGTYSNGDMRNRAFISALNSVQQDEAGNLFLKE